MIPRPEKDTCPRGNVSLFYDQFLSPVPATKNNSVSGSSTEIIPVIVCQVRYPLTEIFALDLRVRIYSLDVFTCNSKLVVNLQISKIKNNSDNGNLH